jgi:hypothetical protein
VYKSHLTLASSPIHHIANPVLRAKSLINQSEEAFPHPLKVCDRVYNPPLDAHVDFLSVFVVDLLVDGKIFKILVDGQQSSCSLKKSTPRSTSSTTHYYCCWTAKAAWSYVSDGEQIGRRKPSTQCPAPRSS